MRRRALIAAAAATLTLSGCGFQGLYSVQLPGGVDTGDHAYNIKIEFADVLDLVPQSSVKVDDIPVGKVKKITLGDNCQLSSSSPKQFCAEVTVEVKGSVDLPANARAEVSQTSLLGEKYVALEQPLSAPSSQTLKELAGADRKTGKTDSPLAATQSAPEAEDVLGALSLLLNEGGVQQIKVIATELNQALNGNTSAVRSLIGQLNTFTKTLGSQVDKITTALESIDRLAITINNQRTVLEQALDTYPQALKVLDEERPKLVTLLKSLSHLGATATNVINATQSQLVTSLKALDPTLKALTSAGAALPGALRIAGTFPFPLGRTRELVKGDYANLDAVVNLNLTQELCGLLGTSVLGNLCKGVQAGASAKATKVTTVPDTTTAAQAAKLREDQTHTPLLLGAGK